MGNPVWPNRNLAGIAVSCGGKVVLGVVVVVLFVVDLSRGIFSVLLLL